MPAKKTEKKTEKKTTAKKTTAKTTSEAKFQADVIKWLKSKGCVVVKNQAGPGVPAGFPDITFFKTAFYGMLEVKKTKTSSHRPGQDKFIEKFDEWSYAKFVYPSNWDEVKAELEEMLRGD